MIFYYLLFIIYYLLFIIYYLLFIFKMFCGPTLIFSFFFSLNSPPPSFYTKKKAPELLLS